MHQDSGLDLPNPEGAARRRSVGELFNPWRRACGFYPPDAVGRQWDLTDGQKRLYERAVRWAGQNGTFWYGFDTIAEALGKSVRQVKDDMAALEGKGLIKHIRRRRQSNKYFFLWHPIFEVQSTALQDGAFEVQDGVILKVQPTARESSPLESCPLNFVKADNKLITGCASQEPRSTASSCAPRASSPKTRAIKADPPAEIAGEETPFSVEEKKAKADLSPPPWTGIDVGQIQKLLSAFMEGEEPPAKLVDWICSTFEGVCPANDVCAALEAAWKRSAAPGKKNAPRTWNWFYAILRNALIPGESGRLPEPPAASHPDHTAHPAAMARGIEAIELAEAPRSIVESVPCRECGGCELTRYSDGAILSCGCREKRRGGLSRIPASSAGELLTATRFRRSAGA